MISYSDLRSRARSYAIAAATAIAGPCRVMSIAISAGTDVGTVSVYNAVTAAGTDVLLLKAGANKSEQNDFEPTGVRFDTGLSIAAGGTPDSICVTYIEE